MGEQGVPVVLSDFNRAGGSRRQENTSINELHRPLGPGHAMQA
jgi:hypothetical protein